MICSKYMKDLFSFWFVRDMVRYEMNPSKRFMMDEKWMEELWGMMKIYGNGDPQEKKSTMGEDPLGITICRRKDTREYSNVKVIKLVRDDKKTL